MYQKSIRFWIIYLPLLGILATYFLHKNLWDERHLEVHQKVLNGTSRGATQYQLPVHEVILEGFFHLTPRRSPGWFSLLYFLYYSTGLILFFESLYRMCLRNAGVLASCAASLYYVAIMPMVWYDCWHSPNDPWGAFLSVLLVRRLFDPKPTASYYSILLVSGFVWDKSVFFPFSRAVADFLTGKRKTRILSELMFGCLLAACGQVFYRWYYGYHPAGVGSLYQNLRYFHLYLLGLLVFQGLPIYYFFQNCRRLPSQFVGLMLQIPAWLLLYLTMNGFIWEYRALFFVSITYSAPLLAMLCDGLREKLNPTENVIPATEGSSQNI